ncbi:carboxylesterase [Mangrovibacterium marinum]|uniref:Esterase/lipase n=1 Tax=Mangrovibacterium marinum TaxID=1639118 RepID=A0A2T5C3P0_9BACT|nr:alpha/beta fold hydrolase [Mangrovibacterium marinum]PTN09356.1 esterase/lipase [Mangrovibacterium marinum]
MKRFLRILLAMVLFLVFLYVVGPRPPKPAMTTDLPSVEYGLNEIEQAIADHESALPVKPDNESAIVWTNDSANEQTDWCLLYLHGFSASRMEGFPTHMNFAAYFGMNAYLPRLASHGLEVPEPLLDMVPDSLYESAKEALQIAHILGKKVVIMSTSTGGTLSLKLAADFPELVDGLILLSPNVAINNPAAFLLSGPWGLQIARQVYHGKYRYTNDNADDEECKYWNCFYRLEAIVYLQQLVDATMKDKVFKQVQAPVFLGYYYQDEEQQDPVVRVDAALRMFDELGTAAELKQKQAFDAGAHVIGCGMYSKAQKEVEAAAIRFGEQILHIEPKDN